MQLRTLVDDRLKQLHAILTAKRRKPANHLVYKTRQAPPIDISPMPDLLNNLRGEILRRPANRRGAFLVLKYLRQPKIR